MKTRVVDLEPTESAPPYKRVISDGIDPTEYSREEYDRKLEEQGINSKPWLKFDD